MRFKRVYIEITNVCNLNCPFCPPHNRENRFMSFDEFKIILDKIKNYTEYIYLHVKGEPTLHPDFDKFVKYANSKGFKINLTTNGTLLSNHLNITKYLRQINISLHATNSEEIIKLAKEINDTIINFRIWNITQNPEAKKLLESEYDVKIIDTKNFTLKENVFLSQDDLFEWPTLDKKREYAHGYCHALTSQIAILSNGTVVPCCLDHNGIINLGNIFTEDFEDIINSNKVKTIIEGFKNRTATCELCMKCSYKERF